MKKIGIFGGSFNPIHQGHINSMLTVIDRYGLDSIWVVPSYISPGKEKSALASSKDRLVMVELAIKEEPKLKIQTLELERKGISYTVDTVSELKKNHPKTEFYLILGLDVFYGLDNWKFPEVILEQCHLIVTSRPGSYLPSSENDLPKVVQDLGEEFSFNKVSLKTKKSVTFLKLEDLQVSSSDVRKKVRVGQNISKEVPIQVEHYIKENKLYIAKEAKDIDFKELTQFCANVLDDKKAYLVKSYDLRNINQPAEFSLVASGSSSKQAQSLAKSLIQSVQLEFSIKPIHIDGQDEGNWVLIDYGSLMVHIFYDYIRNEIKIEELWEGSVKMEDLASEELQKRSLRL